MPIHSIPQLQSPQRFFLCPDKLFGLLNSHQNKAHNLVFVCIGTDRIIGDSLGPIVGSMLSQHISAQNQAFPSLAVKKPDTSPVFYVYGTLQHTVHARNLMEITGKIKKKHANDTIIAIDASLGSKDEIGSVFIRTGTLCPGAGVHKNLPPFGDIAITGIIGEQSRHPYLTLQTVRLSAVTQMAEHICSCILSACC